MIARVPGRAEELEPQRADGELLLLVQDASGGVGKAGWPAIGAPVNSAAFSLPLM